MKEAEKKAIAEFSGSVSCQGSVTSTEQPLRPGHLPPQEVKPSQGIVWPGSLFTTQIASTIHAAGSREAPGQKAEKPGEDLDSRTSSNTPLTNCCRKGREVWPLLGWIPQGSQASPRPESKGGGHLRQASVLKNPNQG